jgi:hypothetical protein
MIDGLPRHDAASAEKTANAAVIIFERHSMDIMRKPPSTGKPRWDGSGMSFEIEIEGRPIACAISRGALQEISGSRHIASGDLLRRFASHRDQIEQIARKIFAGRPEGVAGTLHIWADDIDDPPSEPAVATQAAETGG